MTDEEIREMFGHNGHECRVQVRKDGTVHRYGSVDPINRSMDYWQYLGKREQIVRDLGWTR